MTYIYGITAALGDNALLAICFCASTSSSAGLVTFHDVLISILVCFSGLFLPSFCEGRVQGTHL